MCHVQQGVDPSGCGDLVEQGECGVLEVFDMLLEFNVSFIKRCEDGRLLLEDDPGSTMILLLEDQELERNMKSGGVVQGNNSESKIGVTESVSGCAKMWCSRIIYIHPCPVVVLVKVAVTGRGILN